MLIKSLSWTKATANTIALVLQYYYNLFPFFRESSQRKRITEQKKKVPEACNNMHRGGRMFKLFLSISLAAKAGRKITEISQQS